MSSTEVYLLAVPDGWLRLPADVYERFLVPKETSKADTDTEPLLDAEDAAKALSVSARWLEDAARQELVPYHRLGRFVRFRVSELVAQSRTNSNLPGAMPSDCRSAALRNALNGKARK